MDLREYPTVQLLSIIREEQVPRGQGRETSPSARRRITGGPVEEAAFESGLKEWRGFMSVDRAESYITYMVYSG